MRMTKGMFAGRRVGLWLVAALVLNAVFLAFLIFGNSAKGLDLEMVRTNEPLLIEGQGGDDNYYVLPMGTTLYHDKSFPEGHDRYVVYLNHKGAIAHEEVPMKPEYGGSFIDPLWLANIDADTLKDIFKRFPLSKKDISAALKANEITKDDL